MYNKVSRIKLKYKKQSELSQAPIGNKNQLIHYHITY